MGSNTNIRHPEIESTGFYNDLDFLKNKVKLLFSKFGLYLN